MYKNLEVPYMCSHVIFFLFISPFVFYRSYNIYKYINSDLSLYVSMTLDMERIHVRSGFFFSFIFKSKDCYFLRLSFPLCTHKPITSDQEVELLAVGWDGVVTFGAEDWSDVGPVLLLAQLWVLGYPFAKGIALMNYFCFIYLFLVCDTKIFHCVFLTARICVYRCQGVS